MAEKQGQGRMPEERPDWGKALSKVATAKGIEALEQALRIVCPYTTEELLADQDLLFRTTKEAKPFVDAAVEDIANQITRTQTKEKLLQMDPMALGVLIDKAILEKYPEIAEVKAYSEAFVFNEIREKTLAYILTIVAISEKRHREMHKTLKGKKVTIPGKGKGFIIEKTYTHGSFFTLIDRQAQVRQIAARMPDREMTSFHLEKIIMQYVAIRDFWLPFLRGKHGEFNNPENKTQEELKRENDKIAKLFFAEANREIPLCTIENETLMGEGNPLTMQVAPIDDEKLGMFYATAAQVDYFEPEIGELIRTDREKQERLKPQKTTFGTGTPSMDMVIHLGKYPPMFLDRISGEIKGANVGDLSLKLMAGKGPNYELLRRDVLFYLTQLTCDRSVLEKMFGSMFARKPRGPKQKNSQRVELEEGNGEENPPPNPSTDIIRKYPREDETRDAFTRGQQLRDALEHPETLILDETSKKEEPDTMDEMIEKVEEKIGETHERVQRETNVVGYRRLMTLIKREDTKGNVKLISPKPSRQALENAAKINKELRRGVEFIKTGEVIKPKDMEEFLKGFGVSSIDELQQMFPDEIVILYETWVKPFKRGNPEHGIIETVKADVTRAAKPEQPTE